MVVYLIYLKPLTATLEDCELFIQTILEMLNGHSPTVESGWGEPCSRCFWKALFIALWLLPAWAVLWAHYQEAESSRGQPAQPRSPSFASSKDGWAQTAGAFWVNFGGNDRMKGPLLTLEGLLPPLPSRWREHHHSPWLVFRSEPKRLKHCIDGQLTVLFSGLSTGCVVLLASSWLQWHHLPRGLCSHPTCRYLQDGPLLPCFFLRDSPRLPATPSKLLPGPSNLNSIPAFAVTASLPCPLLRDGLLLSFSCSVVSDSLQPQGLQHSRRPCPSLSPGVCSNSCPLSRFQPFHPLSPP